MAAYSTHIRFLLPNTVRVTHTLPGSDTPPPDRPWLEHVFPSLAELPPDQATLNVAVDQGLVRIDTTAGDPVLHASRPVTLESNGGIELAFHTRPGEGFYGGGEWFNAFRREKGTVRLRSQESLALLQGRRTYSTIPFFVSDQGYAIFVLNSHAITWHVDPSRRELVFKAEGPPADYLVIYGPSLKEIIQTYTSLTGRPPLLPRWAFGLWVTGYPQAHQEQVLQHVEHHRRRDIPLDAVILDYPWEDRFHNFRWRDDIIPDPDDLVARLKAQGMRLGLIMTPFQNNRSRPWLKLFLYLFVKDIPHGMLTRDETAPELYEEARSQGYLAHDDAVWWFGRGGMVDFANPAAAAWWNDLLRPLYDQGVAFFKNDDGEYLPDDAHSQIGMDGREYHNTYGFFYGKAIYEGMQALDDRRPLIYARSVWAGSQRYPALFMGDQKPALKYIRSTMRASMNLALAGFSYWTADVFGLDGETTPETHMRYAQWALLAPIARYFIRPPEIDDTRFPWSHGLRAEANFRTYAQLRMRLLPTYSALAWEAYQTGVPMMRPMMVEFQDDPRMNSVEDQIMLGSNILIAPVTESRATTRTIALPPGTWHDFWTDDSWENESSITYQAPLNRLPLLVRGGSIILLGPPLQHIPEDHQFDNLEVHCYPPYPAETILYDDDGHTRAYLKGAYTTTQIAVTGDNHRALIRISPSQGDWPHQVKARQIELFLHRTPSPALVRINNQESADWSHDASAQASTVRALCPTDSETIVEIVFAA